MTLLIECFVFCLLMWLLCFLGTGGDEKNLKSFSSYPKELQQKLLSNEKYKDKIKKPNEFVSLVSNFFMFLIIIFVFGLFIRTSSFVYNFVALLILGETLNLFDLVVIDLLWWRNIKRIRFSEYPEKELYKNPKQHIISFLKAFVMFALIAVLDGALLMLF